MNLTTDVDISKFSKAMRQMSKETGLRLEPVIKSESGIILKTCAARTKVAPLKRVRPRSRLRAIKKEGYTRGDITVNAGIKGPYGRVWHRTPQKKFVLTRSDNFRRVPGTTARKHPWSKGFEIDTKEAVADVKPAVVKEFANGKRARGLARQSWLQIGDSLGIRLENVRGGPRVNLASARTALASNGRRYLNGKGREERHTTTFFITLINRYPPGRRIGLDHILVRTIKGRTSFFYTNLRKGTFRTLSGIARAYPGLDVRPV